MIQLLSPMSMIQACHPGGDLKSHSNDKEAFLIFSLVTYMSKFIYITIRRDTCSNIGF